MYLTGWFLVAITHLLIIDSQPKAVEKQSRKQKYKIWQEGYHPEAIYSEKWFQQKLNYIHYNPVKKGFVTEAENWKYSSAKNWFLDDHSIINIENIIFLH
jgi:REP element-mobilizing transposase RayT